MSEDFASAVQFEIVFKSHDTVERELPIRGMWQLYDERAEVEESTSVDFRVMVVLLSCIKKQDKEPLEKLVNLWNEKRKESKNDLTRKGHDDYIYAVRLINDTERAIQDYRRIVKEIKSKIEKKIARKARKDAKKALQDEFTKI